MYNINIQIKFKTSTIKQSLCYYSAEYIHVKGTIAIPNTETAAAPNNRNKKGIFSNWAPFTDFISEIKNTKV